MTTPIAIFASGRGSNFDAVQSAVQRGELDAKIVALVSDQPGAPVLAKAKSAGVPTIVVPKPSGSGDTARAAHERAILEKLAPLDPHFIVLAGYMRIMTSTLIEAFRSERGHSRIVNVHPSILPAFPGVNAYEQAFRYGCKVAGVTVHLVEKEVDSGPILAQEQFSIEDCRSVDAVEQRGLAVEHRLYSKTLAWVLPEKFEIEMREGRPCVRAR